MAISPTTPPSFDTQQVLADIDNIMVSFQNVSSPNLVVTGQHIAHLTGAVFELYALSRLLGKLQARGWWPYFQGNIINLRAGSKIITAAKQKIELRHQQLQFPRREIYMDVEVRTLGDSV